MPANNTWRFRPDMRCWCSRWNSAKGLDFRNFDATHGAGLGEVAGEYARRETRARSGEERRHLDTGALGRAVLLVPTLFEVGAKLTHFGRRAVRRFPFGELAAP